jgi:hypothetical protein
VLRGTDLVIPKANFFPCDKCTQVFQDGEIKHTLFFIRIHCAPFTVSSRVCPHTRNLLFTIMVLDVTECVLLNNDF